MKMPSRTHQASDSTTKQQQCVSIQLSSCLCRYVQGGGVGAVLLGLIYAFQEKLVSRRGGMRGKLSYKQGQAELQAGKGRQAHWLCCLKATDVRSYGV